MKEPGVDLAQLRHRNALALFDEFVRATVTRPDAATLRGLERRFAERIGIQPSYWSQVKSRSRQIGERLARQFEQCCGKPAGWLDHSHESGPATAGTLPGTTGADAAAVDAAPAQPRDEDERFIVGLVLSYYRRNPQRARQRLLDLLGEVLLAPAAALPTVAAAPSFPSSTSPSPAATPTHAAPRVAGKAAGVNSAAAPAVADQDLWARLQRDIAPLKTRR